VLYGRWAKKLQKVSKVATTGLAKAKRGQLHERAGLRSNKASLSLNRNKLSI